MNKIATAILAGTFLTFAGAPMAADVENAVKHPVQTSKAKANAERTEDRMENTADTQYKAAKKDADDKYRVAKDSCKDKKGADEKACIKEAKANRDKSVSDAKATRDKAHARADRAGELNKKS